MAGFLPSDPQASRQQPENLYGKQHQKPAERNVLYVREQIVLRDGRQNEEEHQWNHRPAGGVKLKKQFYGPGHGGDDQQKLEERVQEHANVHGRKKGLPHRSKKPHGKGVDDGVLVAERHVLIQSSEDIHQLYSGIVGKNARIRNKDIGQVSGQQGEKAGAERISFQDVKIDTDQAGHAYGRKLFCPQLVRGVEKPYGTAKKQRVPARECDAGFQELDAASKDELPTVCGIKRVSQNHKRRKQKRGDVAAQPGTERGKMSAV